VESGVRKTLPVSPRSRTHIPSGSTVPVGENGTKKRRREVDAKDKNLDPGVAKKMRRETVSDRRSQACDSPPHTTSPSAELRNGKKSHAESLTVMSPGEDKTAPVIGSDDYTGALPGPGESDQEVGGQSEDRGVSASAASVSRPSTPVDKAEGRPSLAPRKYAFHCVVYVSGSSVIQSDPRAHILLEPPQHIRSHRLLIGSTTSPPELLWPKLQGSCATLLVDLNRSRKSQPRLTRVLSTPRVVLSNINHRLRMVFCRNLELARDIRPSPRHRNAFPLLDAKGEMKTISSALHLRKPSRQVHRHEVGEKHPI
jgi:hypothetical protein